MTTPIHLSEMALITMEKRYLNRDSDDNIIETPDELVDRVANHVATAERDAPEQAYWANQFADLISSGKFFPNSPTLMNAGLGRGSLSACFVIPVEDSLYGIMMSALEGAMVQKYGGGTGFSFNRIRAMGSYVSSTHRNACGPVSALLHFDDVARLVTQGGAREGANMGIVNYDHPDVMRFIHAKDDASNNSILKNFNISVGMRKAFFDALDAGAEHESESEFDLIDPTYGKVGVQDAYGMFDEIAKGAWKTGDPGMVFLDRMNAWRSNPVPSMGPIESTNPCITGDTLIATVDGPIRIDLLLGSEPLVHAWNPATKTAVVRRMRNIHRTRQNVPVLKITFDSGLTLRCTPDHHLYTFRGRKVEAQQLHVGQAIRAQSASIHRDGHVRITNGDNSPLYQHIMVWEEANGPVPDGMIVHHKDHNERHNWIENLELLTVAQHNHEHYESRHANGLRGWQPGEMTQETKNKIGRSVSAYYNHKIVAIEQDGYADVYNGTVDEVHTYVIADPEYRNSSPDGLWSGIVSANCGEQPLYPYDSCNLGSIDLAKFYTTGGMDDGIDWPDLARVVKIAVRFLDDVITINDYPLPQIRDVNNKIRRIGLGVMGWADLLYKLDIRYGSQESLDLAEKMGQFIEGEAWQASRELAVDRGPFPAWEESIYNDPDYDAIPARWRGIPIRNSTRTTIAPTGTISIFADTSSGIEPNFALAFYRQHRLERNTETGKNDIITVPVFNPVFDAKLRELEYTELQRNMILDKLLNGASLKDALDLGDGTEPPAWSHFEPFVVSNELTAVEHIKMQAAWQKHTDNAVSKTINMANSVTVDDIKAAYKLAWDLDCLGITIYRDGSHTMQVLTNDVQDTNFAVHDTHNIDTVVPPVWEVPANLDALVEAVTTVPGARRRLLLERHGITRKLELGGMEGYVNVNTYPDGTPGEIFITAAQQGSTIDGLLDAVSVAASIALQYGVPIDVLCDKMEHTKFEPSGMTGTADIPLATSILDYAFRWIRLRWGNKSLTNVLTAEDREWMDAPMGPPRESTTSIISTSVKSNITITVIDGCTICGGIMDYAEGCSKCRTCGYSTCG